jgi:uncharacterized protein (TIGR02678 family)
LQRWFDHYLGWNLVVDRDVIRLHKVPEPRRYHPDDAPSQRCCVLYCLLLAALEDCGEQVIISELGERIGDLAAARAEIPSYDPIRFSDRRDLVSAIRLLVEHGVLLPTRDNAATSRDEREYIAGSGNALYDVDHRAAALLLAAPVPPTRAGTPTGLTRQSLPDIDEATNRRRRHAIMRRLVDDPVLYLTDLTDDELAYYRTQRPALARELRDMLDVRLEVRAEGAAILDDELTDRPFPKDRTSQYAALLLAERLAAVPGIGDEPGKIVSTEHVAALCANVADQVARQVKTIGERPVTAESVAAVALKLLAELRLIELIGDEVRPLAALARYRNPSHRQETLLLAKILDPGSTTAEDQEGGS